MGAVRRGGDASYLQGEQDLLRARTFNEMLEVQARLLRDNMQAFLDQSVRIADSASRPLEAMKEASSEQPGASPIYARAKYIVAA